MSELLHAIREFVSNTPPAKVEQLAGLLRSSDDTEPSKLVDGWMSTAISKQRWTRILEQSVTAGTSNRELAGLLLGASFAHNSASADQAIELVWTGPSSELVATRKTEQALLQIIKSARIKLFLTSFVAYDVAAILQSLEDALSRGVTVSILLEASEMDGGGISIDVIGRMREALPNAKIFSWKDKADAYAGGKVHAKVAVADEHICFVSSANLTGHAMEKNMEAGVLISGGTTPRSLHRHLEALVKTRVIAQV